MNGKPGYIGYSTVYLKYLEDGWIGLSGDNVEENNSWKLISSFELEPGMYTFTGMTGGEKETVALQLRVEEDTGFCHYHYQYDSDVFSMLNGRRISLFEYVYILMLEMWTL